jgi:prepilin-type N-terminal cleavage/methylation domain-containing protein
MRTRIDRPVQPLGPRNVRSMRSMRSVRGARTRDGFSLIEIIVAMTMLVFVLGALSVLTTRTVQRSRDLDVGSARTFVLMQQTNRFSSLPYDSIPMYAPRVDTIQTGRFAYERRLTYVQGATGSEYRTLKVKLQPLYVTTTFQLRPDSLVFLRAKTYAKTPLFQ